MGLSPPDLAQFNTYYNLATQQIGKGDDTSQRSKARLRQLMDQMVDLLKGAGLAHEKGMHCKSIVPHISNRGKSKMQWSKIYGKGAKIIKVGVSLNECGPNKAFAFYEDPLDKKSAKAHIELCKTSPHYPTYGNVDTVDGGSVGCGHWNQFLACVHDSRPVPARHVEELCEEGNPCLDGVRLTREQPSLGGILLDGLRFTMVLASVEKAYPQLPNMIQKALNIEHHIGEGSMHVFRMGVICFSKLPPITPRPPIPQSTENQPEANQKAPKTNQSKTNIALQRRNCLMACSVL